MEKKSLRPMPNSRRLQHTEYSGATGLSLSKSRSSQYLSQITIHRGIPFEIKIPNEVTAKTLKDAENGNDLHEVDSVDALFQELDS